MARSSPDRTPHEHHHAVQFYGGDEELYTGVAGFLSEGLIAGQPAIVIATERHRLAIAQHLGGRLIDVEEARRLGDLVLLDADDVLATFMRPDGMPDAASFRRNVGRIIVDAVRPRRTKVRAYGEMVDVLSAQGKLDAAVRVEQLWNELAGTHAFSLLCGYSKANFFRKGRAYKRVCAEHTHIVKGGRKLLPFRR